MKEKKEKAMGKGEVRGEIPTAAAVAEDLSTAALAHPTDSYPTVVKAVAFARVGWIGNPSDGYYGKTIAFTISNFQAEVIVSESDQLEIVPNPRDQAVFRGVEELVQNVRRFGYYGGIRLLKAAIKRFWDYCREHEIELPKRNFRMLYRSNIPEQVGLAGSSAIITACWRALMRFYGVSVPKPLQPNWILSVETEELGIPAGLQDRVVQVYQGAVYMDFRKDYMESHGHGIYEPLDPSVFPPMYLAYREEASEGTEIPHSDLKSRYLRKDPQVLEAIAFWIELTDRMREALEKRDWELVGHLLNQNFDKRREILRIHPAHEEMIELARSVGASAKFTGSGGAIVGTYQDEAQLERLREVFQQKGIRVVVPQIAV